VTVTSTGSRTMGTTTGITGSDWRASITPWGAIEPWSDTPGIDWYVAADDRWHVPSDEPSVRQTRLDGTPVTETRVRVPNGDVVQRVFSVPDHGGVTVIEVENASTMPLAVAFDRRDVLTERPIADVPIEGIDLPTGSFVMPLGHRATVRIAITHGTQRGGTLPPTPTPRQVANGWLTLVERASRFVLPDGERGAALAERVIGLRCELALGVIPNVDDDPAGFAIALGELVRMGERADPWLEELVVAVERVGPMSSWTADAALVATDRVLVAAGEARARRDLARGVANRTPSPRPATPPDGVAAIAWLESTFAIGGSLMPAGLPDAWLGQPVEVHGVPTAPGRTVSYAVRWHGDRPAVLWEQTGEPVELTAPVVAPGWTTTERSGEALWPVPADRPDPTSFT
jgi:hypothetical protein